MDPNDAPSVSGSLDLTGTKLIFGQPTLMNYQFTISENDSPTYFVKMTRSPNKPDITIRQRTKEGPVQGVSWFRWNKAKLGVGEDEMTMRWSELGPKGPMTGVRHEFEWEGTMYSAHRLKSADRQEMGVKRTASPHFKVVEVASKRLVGVFVSDKGFRGKGSMQYAEGVSEDLQILILLVVASLRERRRRAG